MIIRDLKAKRRFNRPSFGYLLRYIFRDQAALSQNGKGMFVYLKYVKGSTLEDWESSFLENEQYRKSTRKNTVYLRHFVLSFDPKDTPYLNGIKLLDLTEQFIEAYHPRAQAVAAAHFDTDHVHVHVCIATIEYRTGKTIRHSKREFAKLKERVQLYQQQRYPELIHSVIQDKGDASKGKSSGEYRMQKRGITTKKATLTKLLTQLLNQATSLANFLEQLHAKGVQEYYRGGRITGVIYQGRKYRFRTLGFGKELTQFLGRTKGHSLEMEMGR